MDMTLRKAERTKAKMRLGLSGPSGSGKTYSALKLGFGLVGAWEKIALIDTERKSADLYSHLGAFNKLDLEAPFTPERYVQALEMCAKAGMELVIIDSATHEWDGPGGCLEANDKLANAKHKGNTWAAWSETTPRHQAFVNAILQAPMHIITTARSKTETVQEGGKVKKLGMKEIQREGFEYELTINFTLDKDTHQAVVSKDRTELYEGRAPFVIDENTGKQIRTWCDAGVEAKANTPASPPQDKEPSERERVWKDIGEAAKANAREGVYSEKDLQELRDRLRAKKDDISALKALLEEVKAAPDKLRAETDRIADAGFQDDLTGGAA